MRQLWRKYLDLLDKDLSSQIFDNIKNLLACAFLFAAGTSALHSDHEMFLGLLASSMAGWGLIAVSAMLTLLNISDGLRRLSRLRYHTLLQIVVCLLYIVLAVRVVELVWGLRAE